MIAVLTYKCKREDAQVSMPEGLCPLPLVGYSPFEHTLNILDKMPITKLLIMTDGYEEAFENHSAYRKAQEKYACSVIHVEPDFNWHSKVFFDALQQTAEDVVWLCGDMFIYCEAFYNLCNSGKSAYIEIYSSSNIKQHDSNLRFADYLKSYSSVYLNGGTNADTIPGVYFRAGDFKQLLTLSRTLQDNQSIMHLPLSKKNLSALNFLFTVRSQPACLAMLLRSVESQEALEKTILYTTILQQTTLRGNAAQLELERQLIQHDPQTVLFIRNGQANAAQLVFESILKDSPAITPDGQQDFTQIPQKLAQFFPQTYPRTVFCAGDANAYAYAEEVYRYLLTVMPSDTRPNLIRIPNFSALTSPVDFSWMSNASQAMMQAYLHNAWNVHNLATGFDFTPTHRYRLYAFILANCLNILFSTNEEPFFREYAKVILLRFFRMGATPEQTIMAVMETNVIASLCGRTVINTFADKLSKESDLSYGESMLYTLASFNLFTSKNIKKNFVKLPRKILVDNLDDQLITTGVASADELFAVALAMLKLNEHRPDHTQVAAAAASVLTALTDREQNNSLFVPDKKVLTAICDLAQQTTAAHDHYFTDLWEDTLSDLPADPTPSQIRSLKTAMQRKLLRNKYRSVETELFHALHTFCNENNISYRLLRCGNDLDLTLVRHPYMVLLNPWDLDRFAAHIHSTRSDLQIAFGCNPAFNIFADAYLYKTGTILENHWSLTASSAVKEIGIPILTTIPAGNRWANTFRIKLANAFNRIYCLRSGFYVPSLTKSQKLIKAACRFLSTDTLRKIRDRLLKRPAANQYGKNIAYLDLHHVAAVTISEKAVYTAQVFGDEHPVLDAKEHVFTQGTNLLNSLYRPIDTAYRVCYGGDDTYVLRVPDIVLKKGVSIFKRIKGTISRVWNKIRSKIKSAISNLRKAIKNAQTTFVPVKAKLVRCVKLLAGFFRGMGLCIAPKAKAMRAYRNKHAGERCFLVGNGPSLRAEDLDALAKNGEITFACNFIHKIYGSTDWRPTYHCLSDSSTVRTACWDIVRNVDEKTTMVVRDFAYDKMTIKPAKAIVPYSISQDDYKVSKNFLAYHYISHATVMSMMLECAMYMGFKEIYLIGVDATTSSDKGGNFAANYFTPEQRAKLDIVKRKVIKNYDVHARRREIALRQKNVYEMIGLEAQKRNIKIYNATRGGALEAYERVNLDEIIGNP